MIVSHGEGIDPTSAFLHLGLTPDFVTHEDHYAVTLPDGVTEADFTAALAIDPAPIYLAAAKGEARDRVRDAARPLMMDAFPDVAGIVTQRDGLLAQIDAAETIEAVQAIDLTIQG